MFDQISSNSKQKIAESAQDRVLLKVARPFRFGDPESARVEDQRAMLVGRRRYGGERSARACVGVGAGVDVDARNGDGRWIC